MLCTRGSATKSPVATAGVYFGLRRSVDMLLCRGPHHPRPECIGLMVVPKQRGVDELGEQPLSTVGTPIDDPRMFKGP